MFVDITEEKKPLEAEKIYNRCYRGGEEITPEVCMAVLESTNYAACVKRMLTCVERLAPEKQGVFKDVVLATFTNREQPDDVVEIGKRLALKSGFGEAFYNASRAVESEKPYYRSAAGAEKCLVMDGGSYYEFDFAGYEGLVLSGHQVTVRRSKNFPPYIDASLCDEVHLTSCNLGHINTLKLKENSVLHLSNAVKVPEELDVRACYEVRFDECDLYNLKKVRFRDGGTVYFNSAKNLPQDLDVSALGAVVLSGCDLSRIKKLTLKEGAKAYFYYAVGLPADLDISHCRAVGFSGCDLKGIKLDFCKGARVDLEQAKNLPAGLDVSECEAVRMGECDLAGVKQVKFKDKAQMKESEMAKAKNWQGEIEFADEKAMDKEPSLEQLISRFWSRRGK